MSILPSLGTMRCILPSISLVATLFMVWSSLRLMTNCSHPIFVVSSESMEPTFFRGDIILLSNLRYDVQVGDIPVVWFQDRPLPMVHRAVRVTDSTSQAGSGIEQQILTKGDNNEADDTILYPEGRSYVRREEIVGLVWGYVPYIGRLSFLIQEHPWLICTLFGLGLMLSTLA